MRKKVLIALYVLIGIIVVFVIVVATRPGQFSVSRSTMVSAPAAAVFPHVNELKKWEAWNPWGKIDPAMKLTYSGPPSGVGASYSWAGNSQVGEGRATITESRPNDLVQLRLEFFKPMAGVSTAEFTFKPQGNRTEVMWAMTGKNNLIGKAMCLFTSMDTMIGGQFEKGLQDMKTVVETAPKL